MPYANFLPGTQHGFYNDSTPRCKQAAATAASEDEYAGGARLAHGERRRKACHNWQVICRQRR